uniref:Uncharacterized protein n=1 Tax=Salix viminalis TaxID=40686 RepID=A0A6N2MX89_SALVM
MSRHGKHRHRFGQLNYIKWLLSNPASPVPLFPYSRSPLRNIYTDTHVSISRITRNTTHPHLLFPFIKSSLSVSLQTHQQYQAAGGGCNSSLQRDVYPLHPKYPRNHD